METLKKLYVPLMSILIILSLALIVLQYTQMPCLVFILILAAITIPIFILGIKGNKTKLSKYFLCVIICIYIVLGINELLLSIPEALQRFAKILMVACDLITFVGGLMFMNQDSTSKKLNKFVENMEKSNFTKKSTNQIDEEDAILGYEVDMTNADIGAENFGKVTKIPVVLPAKDRFLHMFILGPTGSGKTSQTLIPMIYRDIQISKSKVGVTVIEPKGDLAEKVYAMVNYYNEQIDKEIESTGKSDKLKKTVMYFNPALNECPYFNPLMGNESDVIENMASTFNSFNADSSTYFKDMGESLVRRSVLLLKRLYGDEATFLDFNKVIWNVGDEGRKKYVLALQQMTTDAEGKPLPQNILQENREVTDWFLNDYYQGMSGQRGATKSYENTSAIRTQVTKIVSNAYLRKALNPPKNIANIHPNLRANITGEERNEYEQTKHIPRIDFDEALEQGHIITISTAQGALGDLGRFLGYFIILQLQASVFRRPGIEDTRIHNMLYIDDCQEYANPGFGRMLTQGRSYRVASHLATQARDQVANGTGGKTFLALVSANARNKIIYPGISFDDAKYYSNEFGEEMVEKKDYSYAQKEYFSTLDDKRVTIKESSKSEVRFSPTDIKFLPFGMITHSLIKNNSVQKPGVAKIEFIPKEVNDKLDIMVAQDNAKRTSMALITPQINEVNPEVTPEKPKPKFKNIKQPTYKPILGSNKPPKPQSAIDELDSM